MNWKFWPKKESDNKRDDRGLLIDPETQRPEVKLHILDYRDKSTVHDREHLIKCDHCGHTDWQDLILRVNSPISSMILFCPCCFQTADKNLVVAEWHDNYKEST